MSSNQKDKPKKDDFESEFDLDKIKNMAELDIKPKFDLDLKSTENLGIEYAKEITIKGTYYDVKIPDNKVVGKSNILKALNVIYNGQIHQFFAQAESFRIQLDAIRYKKGLKSLKDIDGLKLLIWKENKLLNTDNFKGKAIVYCLQPID